MDNPVNQVQDTIRQMWYSETNSGESSVLEATFYQQHINLVPTFVHDTFLPYGRPREQVLMKRDCLTDKVTAAFGTFQWASVIGANAASVVVLDAIVITAVYDVLVVACLDPVAGVYYIVQVRPLAGTSLVIGLPVVANGDQLYLTEISTSSAGNLLPAIAVNQMKSDKTIGAGYYAITSGGVFTASSLTAITDTGFPSKQTPALIPTGKFQQLNGHIFIASVDGQIWNSATNDITTWKDSNGNLMNLSANFYPDQLIGLERYKNHIVAFGTNSIEFADDVGATPGPLAVTDQATIKFGAVAPNLIKNLNDQLYWVAYGSSGIAGIWTLDGYTPTKISTAYIDYLLTNQINASGIVQGQGYPLSLSGGTINSRPHLIINGLFVSSLLSNMSSTAFSSTDTYRILFGSEDDNSTPCYNIVDQTWWGFNAYGAKGLGLFITSSFPNPSTQGTIFYNEYVFLASNTTGPRYDYVYKFNPNPPTSIYGDESPQAGQFPGNVSAFPCFAQCNPLWFTNEKRKRVNRFKVIKDSMITIAGDPNTYSAYILWVRDNNMNVVSVNPPNINVRQISIPTPTYRTYINNLGTGRMWAFAYLEKSLSNIRIHAYELDVQQNIH